MTTVTFEWGIIELMNSNDGSHITNSRGEKMCLVRETYHGTTHDPRDWGPMPCVVAEPFIRVRRQQARDETISAGGVRLITN